MVDIKKYKILVISKPRFGSTVFSQQLSNILDVEFINEPKYQKKIVNKIKNSDNIVVKIVLTGKKQWEAAKEILLKIEWDFILLLRRNEDDAKLSLANISNNNFHVNYIPNLNLNIPSSINDLYSESEIAYNEILNMKNVIELSYDNIYNEDRFERERELKKIVGDINISDNIIEKLHPKFKYTNIGGIIKTSII